MKLLRPVPAADLLRWPLRGAACAVALALLAACAAPTRPAADAPQLQRFGARAYPAQHQLETAQSEELRRADGLPLRLLWLRPQVAGVRPLVVYMPGAGQDAAAHAQWRQALARAGYELGAWATLLAAGEQVRGAGVPDARFGAHLAIGPHASFAQGGFDTRWRAVRAPPLSITADADQDPYGLGVVPGLRAAPDGGMPAGQKWLLTLHGATHDALGGRVGAERAQAMRDETAPARAERADRDPDDGGGHRPSGTRRGERRSTATMRTASLQPRAAAAVSPTQAAMHETAMASVSLAFLDAALDDDALARRWLAESAPRWLAPVAALQGK